MNLQLQCKAINCDDCKDGNMEFLYKTSERLPSGRIASIRITLPVAREDSHLTDLVRSFTNQALDAIAQRCPIEQDAAQDLEQQ